MRKRYFTLSRPFCLVSVGVARGLGWPISAAMLRVERLLFIVSLLSFTLVFVYLEIATKPNSLAAEVPPSLIEWRHVPPAPRGLRGLFQPPPPVDTGQWSARESLSIVVVGEGSRTEDTTTRTSGATTAAHEPRLTTDKETSHNATSTTSASSSVSSREDGAGKTGSHTTAAAVATRNSKNAAHDDRIVGRRSQNDATPSTDRQPTLITRSSWKSRATRSSAATTRLPVHTETHRQSSPGAAQRSLGDSSPSTSSPSSVAPSAGHSMQKESLKSESSSLKPVVVGRDMARLPPQTSLAQSRVSQTSSKRKSSKRPVVAQPARSDNSLTQSSAPPLPSRATLPHWFHPETRPYNKYRPRRLPKLTENFTWASELAHKCKEPNCRELLSFVEVSALQVCEKQTLAHVRGAALGKSTCRFIGGYRFPVALNSQEGSGNTWLRGLLEKTTGICTGFYGCDHEMRVRGFVGEEIKSGSVLVVKTHVHIPQWIGQRKKIPYESSYGSAVFLIRNPARGMIAEWSRLYHLRDRRHSQHTHTNVIPESQFGERSPYHIAFIHCMFVLLQGLQSGSIFL